MNKSYFYAAITVAIWSTMAPVVKSVLNEVPNLEAISVSSFFSSLALLAANILSGNLKRLRSHTAKDIGEMAVLGLLVFLYCVLYYYGLSQLTSQEACILSYLWPLMLVLFSVFLLHEKLTVMKVVAMLCSFAGIVILTYGPEELNEGNGMLGILGCVAAAACYGLYSVLNKKQGHDQNSAMLVIWLTVTVCSIPIGPLTETWIPIKGMQWFGLFWMGVMTNAIAYMTWALALRETDNTAVVANMAYLVPFLSLIISAILLGEEIHARAVIALLFIVGGILAQSLHSGKKNHSLVKKV